MKNILIITNYYPPEIGAASNRIFQLANGLNKRDYDVSVITPLPNYPKGKIFDGYKWVFKHSSLENKIHIHRLWIFASNSKNKLLRLFAMLSYSFSLICYFLTNKIPNKVIIQSPPLLVAFTSVLFLKNKRRKLILNVSDLWPIAGLELGALKKGLGYSLLEKMERYNYKNSNLILGQSDEILCHIKNQFPNKDLFLYRNYPDFEAPGFEVKKTSPTKLRIVYAGLLGVAQGVFKLCTALDFTNIELHIYGEGTERIKIETFIAKNSELPITYHGELSREQLHLEIINYDMAIIPLLNRIYGSVPSKIFEYAKLGIPILYFGGGEGEKIVTENNLGWVAKAGDYNHLNETISKIDKTQIFKEKTSTKQINIFDFNSQLDNLVDSI